MIKGIIEAWISFSWRTRLHDILLICVPPAVVVSVGKRQTDKVIQTAKNTYKYLKISIIVFFHIVKCLLFTLQIYYFFWYYKFFTHKWAQLLPIVWQIGTVTKLGSGLALYCFFNSPATLRNVGKKRRTLRKYLWILYNHPMRHHRRRSNACANSLFLRFFHGRSSVVLRF